MYKGTTPSIPIRLEDVNVTEATVYISLYDEQKKQLYTFVSGKDFNTEFDGKDTTTYLSLSQEMTLGLGTGLCTIQARWVFPGGIAGATQKVSCQIQDILYKELIEYGGNV